MPSVSGLGTEPSVSLVASPRADLFRTYEVADRSDVAGELRVNPLYQIERRGNMSVLNLTFPTPEYEEEFGACKLYLPSMVTFGADVRGPIAAGDLGADGDELRRRRVIIDAPLHYC